MVSILIMNLEKFVANFGLTKFSFILLIVVAFLVAGLIYEAYKYGLFQKIIFSHDKFLHSKIVYFNHEGNYQNIGPQFNKLWEDTKDFKISPGFGIYYDDPA